MKTVFHFLDKAVNWLEMTATCLMVLIIFLEVIFRYVFNNALAWPEEIARYLFCWGTYLAVAISMRGDNNLRITILLDALKPRARKMIRLFCCAINICFFAFLAWLTLDLTIQVEDLGERMNSMDVPVWLAWAGLPVCFALITIQAIRNFHMIATGAVKTDQNGF